VVAEETFGAVNDTEVLLSERSHISSHFGLEWCLMLVQRKVDLIYNGDIPVDNRAK
jgi:hypothetical protein